jgi:hypothetical protein
MTSAPDKNTKDTIYIDVDDEITSIIDKVVSSKHKIVALVLPRRSTVLQSLVNMKLLKRSGDSSDKHLVLVTSEPGLLPLAGSVGLYVAKTPTSKPEIPEARNMSSDTEETVSEEDFNPSAVAHKPIGALAGDDPIEIDNRDAQPKAAAGAASSMRAAKQPKKGKNKKLKVPNFGSWRNRIILGVAVLAVLITGWIFAFVVAPKATIAIQTDSESFSKNLDVTLSPTAIEVDGEDMIVPARIETVDKTTTATAEASGQENRGERANGSVKFTAERCAPNIGTPPSIPAGTGVSAGGKTYITQQSATFGIGGGGGSCATYTTSNVEIRAQSGGADFNTSGQADFSVAGRSDTSGRGSATGGTDQIVKILSQADIDGAKKKLADDKTQQEAAKQELTQRLRTEGEDNFVIEESFQAATPAVTESAKAGNEVASVTITQKITFSMASASNGDLEELVAASIKDDIDTEKQKVLESGLDEANFRLQNYTEGNAIMALSTRVTAGPKLDEESIKRDAAGKKAGDIEEVLSTYPGVEGVTVRYSPFWVSSVPKNVEKITVEYE